MSNDLISALYYARDALNAFSTKTQVNAYNIANISTDGFESVNTLMADGSAGKSVRITALTRNGNVLHAGDNSLGASVTDDPSGVDLAKEMTGLIIGQRSFEANVKTAVIVDSMLGVVLDMKS